MTDNFGLSGSVSHTVTITDEAPTAAFTFSPASPVVGSSVGFNATTSSDPDGHIATYAWNYGDGSAGGGATSSHTYTHAGTYTATLTIADSDGQSAIVSHTVTVAPGSTPPPSYSPPTAAFSAPSGNEGVPMTLSGAGSTDPNPGGSLSYAWSFGDGSPAGTGRTIAHAFQAGTWTVTLTVTDSASGLKGSASHLVAVADEAPRAAFTDPTGRAGQVIAFSGSGTDTDGSIAAYEWNFGDGATAAGSRPTHVYATAGSYMATLTVVDSSGQTASVSHTVYIGARATRCVVPRLKGMTLAQARRALSGAHCALGRTQRPKAPKKKAGRGKHWELIVAKQTPAPGTTERNGKPGRAEARPADKAVLDLAGRSGQRPRASALRPVGSQPGGRRAGIRLQLLRRPLRGARMDQSGLVMMGARMESAAGRCRGHTRLWERSSSSRSWAAPASAATPPTASFTVSAPDVTGSPITFDASASNGTPTRGSITNCHWTSATGRRPSTPRRPPPPTPTARPAPTPSTSRSPTSCPTRPLQPHRRSRSTSSPTAAFTSSPSNPASGAPSASTAARRSAPTARSPGTAGISATETQGPAPRRTTLTRALGRMRLHSPSQIATSSRIPRRRWSRSRVLPRRPPRSPLRAGSRHIP